MIEIQSNKSFNDTEILRKKTMGDNVHSNYFKSVYCISGENCFTALLDDPALDDFNVGEFDRFSGEITFLIRQILNNFLYQFC